MIVSGQYVPSLFILIHSANVKKEFRISGWDRRLETDIFISKVCFLQAISFNF